jgi:hypothetical protein
MYSIFHFWTHLHENRARFAQVSNLENFPFDSQMLACRNKANFPDLAIRINPDRSLYTGGELVEIKDSQTYTVTSFNSTIPTGRKPIADIISSKQSKVYKQMLQAGEVYDLVRGQEAGSQKICLVHGSFFETLQTKELIRQSFRQLLDEKLANRGLSEQDRQWLTDLYFEQSDFSQVRNVEKASVKLRFRIMTEVKPEGNILQYPEIPANTLSLIVPAHDEGMGEANVQRMRTAIKKDFELVKIFSLKHPLNGWFTVFQAPL